LARVGRVGGRWLRWGDGCLQKKENTVGARSFEELEVWKKAHQFVLDVYKISARFPREELFGLTSQLRRAAVSVPANLAEGFVKRGKSDKLRFYNIAQGSLEECRYYLRLVCDLHYGDTAAQARQVEEISRMLEAYIHAIVLSRIRMTGFLMALAVFGFWLLASGF